MNFNELLNGNWTSQNDYSSTSDGNESQLNPQSLHNSIVSITNLEVPTNIYTTESSNDPLPYKNSNLHRRAHKNFIEKFIQNQFGFECMVCDRLWFEQDLKKVEEQNKEILRQIPVRKDHLIK